MAYRLIWAVFAALFITGCAAMNYDSKISAVADSLKSGNLDKGIAMLDSQYHLNDKGLLYYLEKGELQRTKGSYSESRDTWLQADKMVRQWEDEVKTNPSKLLGNVGSVLINDTTRLYDGRDYEKVFLNVKLAMDHLSLGNWDDARIEIKKMHEREAIIADFRSKELDKAKADAQAKGIKVTSFKELNGYPIETLEAPEVQELKNSYESAFANYLAGFVYEALGEPSLAAPGYRKAAQMRPNKPLIDDALSGLDKRIRARDSKNVDTLFVIESGDAPAIKSQEIGLFLPVPCRNGLCPTLIQISWPVIRPTNTSIVPDSILIDNQSHPVTMLTSVDAMARRALFDEMPGIIARSSIRAIAKAATQKAVDDNSSNMGLAGGLLSLATIVATAVSEVADERAWRTLPGFYSVTRVKLAVGAHKITIQTPSGPEERDIQVSGRYMVIALRTAGNKLYLAQPKVILGLPNASSIQNPKMPIASANSIVSSGG